MAADVRDALCLAIEREEESHRFYAGAAARAADPAVRETFAALAEEELGHRAFLQRCLADEFLLTKIPASPDHGVAEASGEVPLSVDLRPADALALAMKKEQQAAEFYRGLARAASDPALRAAFENIARMELGHKARLEGLYVDVGFPEAF